MAIDRWISTALFAKDTDQDVDGLQQDAPRRSPQFQQSIDQHWGRSESLDPDNVGDIADEGAGHRG
jgi:hypothetical protein